MANIIELACSECGCLEQPLLEARHGGGHGRGSGFVLSVSSVRCALRDEES